MRNIFLYIVGMLQLMALFSCNDSEVATVGSDNGERCVWVKFQTTIPLSELPSSRAITDDSAINNYVIWVFSDNKFVEDIHPTDTYEKDGVIINKVTLDGDGNMYILLPEDLQKVTLAMIANLDTERYSEPDKDTSIDNLNAEFLHSNSSGMPMYGVNDRVFDVELGANGGTIVLLRAMAKVEVHIVDDESGDLSEIYVCEANSSGTIKQVDNVVNDSSPVAVQGEANDKVGLVYVPEIASGNQGFITSCVIVKINDKYYKFNFVGRSFNDGSVEYYRLDKILRNHRYIFEVKNLSIVIGYDTFDAAVAGEAANAIPTDDIKLAEIKDEYIKDITTNNYIYLGLTSSELEVSEVDDYYVANVSVITNHTAGWRFETPLPAGVEVSMTEDETDNTTSSVWIFLDKNTYSSKASVTLYVLVGNIRKSITITLPGS